MYSGTMAAAYDVENRLVSMGGDLYGYDVSNKRIHKFVGTAGQHARGSLLRRAGRTAGNLHGNHGRTKSRLQHGSLHQPHGGLFPGQIVPKREPGDGRARPDRLDSEQLGNESGRLLADDLQVVPLGRGKADDRAEYGEVCDLLPRFQRAGLCGSTILYQHHGEVLDAGSVQGKQRSVWRSFRSAKLEPVRLCWRRSSQQERSNRPFWCTIPDDGSDFACYQGFPPIGIPPGEDDYSLLGNGQGTVRLFTEPC